MGTWRFDIPIKRFSVVFTRSSQTIQTAHRYAYAGAGIFCVHLRFHATDEMNTDISSPTYVSESQERAKESITAIFLFFN